MLRQVVDTLVLLGQTPNALLGRNAMLTQHAMKLILSCAERPLMMLPQTAMSLAHRAVLPNAHLESRALLTQHAIHPILLEMNLR